MLINDIVKIAYPDYTGRKVTLGTSVPRHLDSYWDEGYRSYYTFVRLADKLVHPVPSNHPAFESSHVRYLVNDLPMGWALVVKNMMGMKTSVNVYLGTGTDAFPVLRA